MQSRRQILAAVMVEHIEDEESDNSRTEFRLQIRSQRFLPALEGEVVAAQDMERVDFYI